MDTASVLCPTVDDLVCVTAYRLEKPPQLLTGTKESADRIRAAIANSGFALPTGELVVGADNWGPDIGLIDLAAALAILLTDPAHTHLRRDNLVAWGHLSLDGTLRPTQMPLVNNLPPSPCVGRFWDPIDGVPKLDDDVVLSVFDVADLQQAWDVIVGLTVIEEQIYRGREVAEHP
jgi:hypothetical protein